MPLKRTGLTEPVTFGPNVDGYITTGLTNTIGVIRGSTGAFTASIARKYPNVTAGTVDSYERIYMNLGSYKSVYTDLGKVYPLSIVLNYIIKA